MNLEGLLEDLEAQGFFETYPKDYSEKQLTFTKYARVVLGDYSQKNILLSMPLIGEDFVAGFTKFNSRTAWVLIHKYSLVRLLDEFQEPQHSSIKISQILEQQLQGINIRIKLDDLEPELFGIITGVENENLRFNSEQGMRLLLPIRSIGYVVVDKLSIQQKVSAT